MTLAAASLEARRQHLDGHRDLVPMGRVSLPKGWGQLASLAPASNKNKSAGGLWAPMGLRVYLVEAAGRERSQAHMAQFSFPCESRSAQVMMGHEMVIR